MSTTNYPFSTTANLAGVVARRESRAETPVSPACNFRRIWIET